MAGVSYQGKTERDVYNDFIIGMRDYLQGQGIVSRVEYAGSRFKNTATAGSDYDNMFVFRDTGITATPIPGQANFARLQKGVSPVSRSTRLQEFRNALQKGLRQLGVASYVRIINSFGPTNVICYDQQGRPKFTIDMVYAIDVGDRIFVAKSPSGSSGDDVWYTTQVLDEKQRMQTIDQDNGVGKMVVRLVKTYKESKSDLNPIPSYAFEQVLMYLKDKYKSPAFWREDNITQIMTVFLQYMAECLSAGNLPSYMDNRNNALAQLTDVQKVQLARRFTVLSRNPREVIHN